MKHILHDWDDERCVAILSSCREALPPHGNVIIVDNLIDPNAIPYPTVPNP